MHHLSWGNENLRKEVTKHINESDKWRWNMQHVTGILEIQAWCKANLIFNYFSIIITNTCFIHFILYQIIRTYHLQNTREPETKTKRSQTDEYLNLSNNEWIVLPKTKTKSNQFYPNLLTHTIFLHNSDNSYKTQLSKPTGSDLDISMKEYRSNKYSACYIS